MTVTWAGTDDVTVVLGGAVDGDLLDMVVDAANGWAFRRRRQSGYFDDPSASPGPDVTLGTALFAKALYLERGAVDGVQGFQELDAWEPASVSFAQVKRLLGIDKPAVF